MKPNHIYIFLGLCVYMLQSCSVYQSEIVHVNKQLPIDSIESSRILEPLNWSALITDPNLLQLIEETKKSNFDLKKAEQRVEAYKEIKRVSKFFGSPEIALQSTPSLRRFGLYTMDGAGNITTEITPGQIIPINLPDYNFGIMGSWEIDLWEKNKNRRKGAAIEYSLMSEKLNFNRILIISEVASAYYTLQSLDLKRAYLLDLLNNQDSIFNAINLLKEAGLANDLALRQVQVQQEQCKVMLLDIDVEIRKFENVINFLLGRFPQPITRSSIELFDTPSQWPLTVSEKMIFYRPDVQMAELQVQQSNCEVLSARAAFLPSIVFNGNIGLQAFSPSYLMTTPASLAYGAFGGLTAPLFNRSEIKAQFALTKADQIDALLDYQQTLLNAFMQVQQYSNQLYSNRTKVNHVQEQVKQLDLAVKQASELYVAGRTNYTEVFMLRQVQIEKYLECVDFNLEMKMNELNLFSACGGGWQN